MHKTIKYMTIIVLAVMLSSLTQCKTETGSVIFEEAVRQIGGVNRSTPVPLSEGEINAGLRTALRVGTENVAVQLGEIGGFWQDPNIRIPLPDNLQSVRDTAGRLGLAGPFDDLAKRANNAVENAMPEVKAVFVSAINQMTLRDVFNILNGGDNAATTFFRQATNTQLTNAITPFVSDALEQAAVFQIFDGLMQQYQLTTLLGDWKSSFTHHVVDFGLDGIFYYLAKEEAKIRNDPVARTSEILRRVFGAI